MIVFVATTHKGYGQWRQQLWRFHPDPETLYNLQGLSLHGQTEYKEQLQIAKTRIPIATSRLGFFASCAAVETASNPIYAKKIIPAALTTPAPAKITKVAGIFRQIWNIVLRVNV